MKIFSKYILPLLALSFVVSNSEAQKNKKPLEKSLLWEISGNGLEKPSYLYGTIHMLCKEDAVLSDSLKAAIGRSERVYLEVDMDNLLEMFGAMTKMRMKDDTTLADLLNKEDYEKVKDYMENKSGLIPFSELEKYKPMLASSLLMETGIECDAPVAMEQLIMEEAKQHKKRVDGLETMAYQLSIFDSIPYKLQAEELLKYINDGGNQSEADKEFEEMVKAYKEQDLEKLGAFIQKSDGGMGPYEDILLYHRNRNWVQKLKAIMSSRVVTIAVGAGHLPGEKGLISLLQKEGYTVRPIKNNIHKQRVI